MPQPPASTNTPWKVHHHLGLAGEVIVASVAGGLEAFGVCLVVVLLNLRVFQCFSFIFLFLVLTVWSVVFFVGLLGFSTQVFC